jgi:hypothetical protein
MDREKDYRIMRRVIIAVILSACALSAQSVRQTTQLVSGSSLVNIYAVTFYWQGDGSGVVTKTAFTQAGSMQGWRIIAAEFAPGTPAPSGSYSVSLLDSVGVDLLQAGGGGLSATTASSVVGSPAAPPLYGTFSLSVTGNSVASAQGTVIVYLSPFNSVVSMGAGGGGGGGSVSSVFGRVGAVVAALNDYDFNQLAGSLATSQVGTPQGNGTKVQLASGTTTNGNALKYDVNGNAVDAGVAAGNATQVNGGSVPASANPVSTDGASKFVAATVQGNGTKVQLSTGSTVTGNAVKYDANGNAVDSGIAAGNATNVNGATVPNSLNPASTNGSGQIVAATVQGNGTKVQLSTGTTTTNHCVKYDANGNTVDNGDICPPTPIAVNTGVAVVAPWGPVYQFTDPTIPSFSWVNQGSATVGNSGPTTLLTSPTNGAHSWNIREIAAPATPYTITVAFQVSFIASAANGALFAGLVMRESGTSKFQACDVFANGATLATSSGKWTNETTFSANYGSTGIYSYFATSAIWVRMTDTGTNIQCSYSGDGTNFVDLTSQSRTDFMAAGPNQVGFALDNNNTTKNAYLTLLSWKQT